MFRDYIVSVVKIATVLEEWTNEEQRSIACFLWAKGLNSEDIRKDFFSVYVGSVCRAKLFTTGWQTFR
jgi:TPP-dependent 2-oxoacid decarboxylase